MPDGLNIHAHQLSDGYNLNTVSARRVLCGRVFGKKLHADKSFLTLQFCVGLSMLMLCGGGAVSMVSGSVVQFRVAGANFSVNQKLEQVELIKETLENTTIKLKRSPKVNRLKIQQIEQQLQSLERFQNQRFWDCRRQSIDSIHDDPKMQVYQDLDKLGKLRGN